MPRKRKKSSPDSNQAETKKTKARTKKKMAQKPDSPPSGTPQFSQIFSGGSATLTKASQPFHLQQPTQYNNQFMAMNSASPVLSQFSVPTTPTNVNIAQGTDVLSLLNTLISKVDLMDSKLTQLESIQSSVTYLTAKVSTLDSKFAAMEVKVTDIEQSRQFDSGVLDEISKKQKDMEALLNKMKQHNEDHKRQEEEMKQEVLDLKCRSMRDNLLFFRIPEEKEEDCEKKVLEFIETKLEIDGATADVKLHRTHRVGRFTKDKVRPIVGKFAYFPDRERVRKAAKKLKDTPFGIAEQFPKEIVDNRRKLAPILRQARQEGKDAYMSVDKLFINGREYKPNN